MKVNSSIEMEKIAGAIDQNEADCILIAGDEGAFCHAITGICENDRKLPIALFPGFIFNLKLILN